LVAVTGGGGDASSWTAGGEGSIIPIPVSSVPKFTRIPSSNSGGSGGMNATAIKITNKAIAIIDVPIIPFFFSEGILLRSLF